MSWPELTALLLFASAMSFTPGPNTTLAAALGANLGLRRAMRFVLAVPVGWTLLLLGCTAGLGAALQALPGLRGALKLAGLAYMLWLAWKLARSATLPGAAAGQLDVGFVQGVALQFVNVKAWLAALAITAGWITVAPPLVPRLAVVLPLMMGFAIASNVLYALAGAALRGWLAQGARLLWFNRAMAALLAATAAWMARP
jgi:threonine/homoserine/homoserine lactone efflux protein